MIDPDKIVRAVSVQPLTTAGIAAILSEDYDSVRDQIAPLLKAGRLKVYGHRGGEQGAASDRIPIFEAVPAV